MGSDGKEKNITTIFISIGSWLIFATVLVCVNRFPLQNSIRTLVDFTTESDWKILLNINTGIYVFYILLTVICLSIVLNKTAQKNGGRSKYAKNWAAISQVIISVIIIIMLILAVALGFAYGTNYEKVVYGYLVLHHAWRIIILSLSSILTAYVAARRI